MAVNHLAEIPQEGIRENDELDLLTKTVKSTDAGKDLIKQQKNYESEVGKLFERRERMNRRRDEFLMEKMKHQAKLKENELLKTEAEQLTQTRGNECENVEMELQRLRSDLLEAEKAASRMKQLLGENRCFAQFMTKVSQCSDQFETVEDVMRRYESLTEVLNHLLEKRKNLREKLVKEQQEEENFNQIQSTELLKETEKLSSLKLREERLNVELEQREQILTELENDFKDNLLLKKKRKLAVKNMYALVISFTKPTGTFSKTEDPVKQLKEIDQFISKWSDIVDSLKAEDSSNSLRALASESR